MNDDSDWLVLVCALVLVVVLWLIASCFMQVKP